MSLLFILCNKKYSVHRANTRKVKSFIRSFGNEAKTDVLDSKALAFYGFERQDRLEIFKPLSETSVALFELVQRRKDLTQMLVAEKNRAKAPKISEIIKRSCENMIKIIADQIAQITNQIKELIAKDKVFLARLNVLKTVPGIGDMIA
jgi:transposase